MITNTTKKGWVFHAIRVLEIAKEKIVPITQRLSLIVSIESLDSSTSHLHLGCKVLKTCLLFLE